MSMLAVAPWTPDNPALTGGSVVASGVVPVSDSSYGPVPSFASTNTGTLAGISGYRVTPAMTIDAGGGAYLSVGTEAGIFVSIEPGTAWVNLSTVGSAYSGGPTRQAQFKNQVISVGAIPSQIWTMANNGTSATGTFSNLAVTAGPAPIARFVTVTKNFCVLAYADLLTNLGVNSPYRICWSGFNDPTNWPTWGTTAAIAAQADYNDFDGSMGVITGLCGKLLNADMLVFFEYGIEAGSYVGPPNVFDFSPIVTAKGTHFPDSIVVLDGMAYYYSENGFYVCDGANVQPLGFGKVDNYVRKNLNVQQIAGDLVPTVSGGYDPILRCLFWFFCPSSSGGAPTPASPGTLVLFHVPTQRFTSIPTAGLITSFLWRLLSNNHRVMAVLDVYGNAFTASGPALAALMSTVEAQPNPRGRSFVKGARLAGDAGSAGATIAIAWRNSIDDAQTITAAAAKNIAGDYPQRAEGRYMQALIDIPAGAAWTNVQGVDLDFIPSGTR